MIKSQKGLSSTIILVIIILVAVGIGLTISLFKVNKTKTITPTPLKTTTTTTTTTIQGETSSTPEAVSSYTGFMKMNKGAWTEVVTNYSSGKSTHQKAIYLGKETIGGVPSNRIEVRGNTEDGSHFVVQLWIKQGTRFDIVKVASKGFKDDPSTYCANKSLIEKFMPNFKSQIPSVDTPNQYQPTLPDITFGSYTTPTGKTVPVAKFKGNAGEGWVSSKVPFGMVKMIDTTVNPPKTTVYLYDFGLTNGQPELSDEEIAHCKTIPSLPF